MATKELTVQEKLEQLHTLQATDSKLDEIEILKGELPMEVSDLEDEIIGLETRITKLTEGVEEIGKEVNNHTGNIADSEALIEKYNSQLDNVKNNREYDALTKEISLQKLEIQLSEKKIRDTGSSKEAKETALESVKVKLASRKKDLEDKKVALEKIIAKTEKEEVKLRKATEKVRKNIDARLLKSYEKIRKNYRNGLAVVQVKRGSCGGCFNRIPPQQIIEIGVMKRIIACEHCGRVIVNDTFGATEKKKK
ncbi:MAG: C4-type zinc ribbon domain-containing protein [Saprospiraceae bacterium]